MTGSLTRPDAFEIFLDALGVWSNRPSREMVRSEDFRRIALEMEGAIESEHMAHPDFRANGRIFATIQPDHQRGMVKLPRDQQQNFVRANPATFAPANGAWGRQGATMVRLDSVDEATLREAMTITDERLPIGESSYSNSYAGAKCSRP